METGNAPPPQPFLPPELILQIAGFLDARTLASFVCTSHQYAALLAQSLFARHLIFDSTWEPSTFAFKVDMKKWQSEYILNCLRRLPDWIIQRKVPSNDSTLLHYAASSGNIAVIQILIERGSDVNAVNSYLETPLTNAAKTEKPEVFHLLLKHGADPLKKINHLPYPRLFSLMLYTLSATMVRTCIDAIRTAGGIVDVEGEHGIVLLQHAIYRDSPPIIQLVFDMGFSPLTVKKPGYSYLRLAVENAGAETCRIIYNALMSATNGEGQHLTIEMLLVAIAQNHGDLVLFFLNAWMDILSPIDAENLGCFKNALRCRMRGCMPFDLPVQALQYLLRDGISPRAGRGELPQANKEELPQPLLNIDLANENLTVFDLALRFGLKESTEAILRVYPALRQSKHYQAVDFESFIWRKDDEKAWEDLKEDAVYLDIEYYESDV